MAPTRGWSVERANSSRSVVYALRVLLLRLARKRSRRPRARAIPSESPSLPFKTQIPLRHSLGPDGGRCVVLAGPARVHAGSPASIVRLTTLPGNQLD